MADTFVDSLIESNTNATPMIITPTSLTISQLLGSTNEQYVIPAYQRRYSWKEKQLWELLDDISLISGADTHLLGSIVCLTGAHVAGINKLELVDGQQRLTTISILLHCIHDRLLVEGETSEAQDVARLMTAKALGGNPVRKIALDSIDAEEFERLAKNDIADKPDNPSLQKAFQTFREWVAAQPLAELGTFLYRLKNQAIIIRLDVSEAKDAFKLFETINNRGLRLSPPDIIKNFLLGNAARFDADALALARLRWAELIKHLDGISFEAFFRQFLVSKLKRRIRISQVIAEFKHLFMTRVREAALLPERHHYLEDEDLDEELAIAVEEATDDAADGADDEAELDDFVDEETERIPFAEFMKQLVQSASAYGEIVRAKTGSPKIDRHLRNLQMIKSQQTYGFLMYLRVGGVSDDDFCKILRLTESFVLRRHICRMRSSENETVFGRLCGVNCEAPLDEVTSTYREYSPSDEKFSEEFSATNFSAGVMDRARYCLEQFEFARQGQHLELLVGGPDIVHVEHIIPQKIKTKKAKDYYGDWPSYLGPNAESRHSKFVSRIGNLTLFAGPLNIGASNNPYKRKKEAYLHSALKVTNSLPSEYPDFRFAQVEKRSEALAKLATQLWPIP